MKFAVLTPDVHAIASILGWLIAGRPTTLPNLELLDGVALPLSSEFVLSLSQDVSMTLGVISFAQLRLLCCSCGFPP